MTFNRLDAIPRGHRLYSSKSSLSNWGTTGPRVVMAANDNFDSRGNNCTKPEVPGDWTTSKSLNTRPVVRPIKEWTWGRKKPEFLPGNDNRQSGILVSLPNDGPTPEWRAERDAAGFAIDYGSEGNRIERALVKEKSPFVAALRQVKELMRPAVVAANDNAPSTDEFKPANAGKGHERIHNQGCITPSVPMLLRAVSDGMRPRVVRNSDGSITRIDTKHCPVGGWHLYGWVEGRNKLHGIIVSDGELVAYGNDKGRRCRPAYNANRASEAVVDDKSETAKHIAAQPEENRTYIRLAGRERYISSQRPDAPGSIAPPPRTARAIANDNILSTTRANTTVMPVVKKLPDGPAKDYGRLAGIAETTGIGEGKKSASMHEALSEMERSEKLEAAGLRDDDMEIIESILSDESFRTIGLSRGYAESSAHRMGRKAVERALQRISNKIAV